MIRATLDTMIARRFGRIVNITNVAIKGGLPDLGLSAGAVSGLTGFVSALARQTVGHNVTINNLVPGRFDTDRLQSNIQATAQRTGQSLEEARAARIALTPAGRFGDPGELGDACAYLCSAQAGYITGQNLVIDGGGYPGTF
jgi:3-oxoacyl-[acyl-carrier protein] reductase